MAILKEHVPDWVFAIEGNEAIGLFNEFLALDPGWLDPKKAGAYYMMGLIYEEKKMPKESQTAFKSALKHHRDKWMKKDIEKRFKNLKNI